jgi:DNA-binding CsgD family transcriptional regulator
MARREQEVAGKGAPSETRGALWGNLPAEGASSESVFVGVFDWNVDDDVVRGDGNLAEIFSKAPDEVAKGLPLSAFLETMHPDDVKPVEQSIAQAVQQRQSFAANYRVRAGSEWKQVQAIGRCYQTEDGVLRFAGALTATNEKPPTELPPRELECLNWCSQGKTNWEIGRILGISDRTVEHHIASAVRRLGCTGRVQAVALALRTGLIK